MGAVVSDYVQMKEWSILGEAGLARQGQLFKPGEIGVGVPAKIVGNIHDPSREKVKAEVCRDGIKISKTWGISATQKMKRFE